MTLCVMIWRNNVLFLPFVEANVISDGRPVPGRCYFTTNEPTKRRPSAVEF